MSVLLQISDTHFGTERPEVMQALGHLVREHRPNVLVVSGDVTQRARRPQFEAASAFFQHLAIPKMLVIPGNHDIPLWHVPKRVFNPYGEFCRVFGNDLSPELSLPGWLVLGVKTTRRWRHTQGQVSEHQINAVARRLRQATAQQCRVVVVHQPMAVTDTSDHTNLLRHREAAAQAWAAAGADLILGGHIHLPYALPLHELMQGISRPLWCVQAGTAISTRVRGQAGNSVNLLHHLDGSFHRRDCRLQRWTFDEASQRFQLSQSNDLSLNPLGAADGR